MSPGDPDFLELTEQLFQVTSMVPDQHRADAAKVFLESLYLEIRQKALEDSAETAKRSIRRQSFEYRRISEDEVEQDILRLGHNRKHRP